MSDDKNIPSDSTQRRVNADMIDSFDEELEMELDDKRLSEMLEGTDATFPAFSNRAAWPRRR